MKTITQLSLFVIIAAIAASCSTGGGEKTAANAPVENKKASFDKIFVLNPEQSQLTWEGYKPTGQHYGTVGFTQGDLKVKDGVITGGKFTFDMNSITVLDLTDAEWNGKLTGHLKSPDFFEVGTFPQATFEITGVQPIDATSVDKTKEKGDIVPTHAITGNLTMKGITKSITFNARVDKADNMVMAESNMFFIDRTEWNIQYKSKKISAKFKDDFINDEMGIKFKVVSVPGNEGTASL
jgi:polyisoprenoid-binding protein YceI